MHKFTIQIIFGVIFIFALLGCQTSGSVIEESNYSLKQHRIAITAALGLVRAVSQNGREIVSYYHDRKFKGFEVTAKTKERMYTKAIILGNRRPYSVRVEVHMEKRDPDTKLFEDIGLDEELSEKRLEAIQEMLNQSRDEGRTFDEEPPF